MDNLSVILDNHTDNKIYIDRAGVATMAMLAASAVASGRTAVIVTLGRDDFYEALALARLFSPQLSADDYPVAQPLFDRPLLGFPDYRQWRSPDAWAMRMASFYGLLHNPANCVVTGMQNLLTRFMPRDFFDKNTLDLAIGMEFSPDLIIDQAMEWGYERAQMVTRPGELARRGDILDIFIPGYAKPARLEFFGDNIEDMRLFDAESQRSLRNIEEIILIPTSPLPHSPQGLDAVKRRLAELGQEGKLSENEAYSLKKNIESGGQEFMPGIAWKNSSSFEDWLPKDALWILPGEAECAETMLNERMAMKEELENESGFLQQPARLCLRKPSSPAPWNSFQSVFFEPLRMGVEEKGLNFPERDLHQFSDLFPLPEDRDRPWQTLVKAIKTWTSEKKRILLAFATGRGRNKFLKLAEKDGIAPLLRYSFAEPGLYALVAPYHAGAELAWDNSIALGEDVMYPHADKRSRKASRAFKGLDTFDDLKPGDLLVHRDYGIGRYAGLHHLEINDAANDFLLIEYAGHDKLYVPADRLGLIQRFKGQEGVQPALDRLGGQGWVNSRERARKAIERIAADLVEMYAYRKVAKSFQYDPPGELYREFEATFGFEETPDQARAIQDVLEDMGKSTPMDRLVCGDVGFGKTEVALRAAFRAAAEGRQVALLCPTTVLAEQHYQTFRARLAGFPVNVGLLSRFVPRTKQKEVLKACSEGQIDILIGTHRLLSSDVNLPNLSLLILDEEQRFGVRHKEKLKSLKKNVDVLTLTATPIPRTLQLSMSGIRDLSIIETAPEDRKPVASAIINRDDDSLRKILEREIERQGQVFWVYNRVQGLEEVAAYARRLCPGARVGMAHGQMGEQELETTMHKFWHGELDVLVCTAIVESGLDFPRANTLVVDQAQMFGLGQLYQLRGRVGRSDRQAYAYFVTPGKLTDLAEERLRIILNMDYLGAGFQVAMEDLRLRGAGNILGEAQSGHIAKVGLDMYLEMLEEAVNRLKGMPENRFAETELNLGVPAHIPATYIDDSKERLRCYKSLTAAKDGAEMEEIALGLRDRFGPFPFELQNFLAILDFKRFLGQMDVEKGDIHQHSIKLVWRKDQKSVSPEKLFKVVEANPTIKLIPPDGLNMALPENESLAGGLAKARKILEELRQ